MNRVVIAVIAVLLLALWFKGCGGPPQMGADREAFKAVDALYTAIGLRDAGRVDQCGARLKSLRDAGKLPERAYQSVASIIAEAKEGKWEPSQERLSQFMVGQHR
jgi:hypothetical protein